MAKVYYISGLKPQIGLTFNGQQITANSQPVLDGWGPGAYWGCTEWQAWFAELLKISTPQQAALIFTQAWNQQDSFAGPYNWCKYDSAFRTYMRNNGVNIDSIVSAVVMPIFDATGNIAQAAGNTAGNTATLLEQLSAIAKYAVPVLLVGGIAYIATNSKARSAATKLATRAIAGTNKKRRK